MKFYAVIQAFRDIDERFVCICSSIPKAIESMPDWMELSSYTCIYEGEVDTEIKYWRKVEEGKYER